MTENKNTAKEYFVLKIIENLEANRGSIKEQWENPTGTKTKTL